MKKIIHAPSLFIFLLVALAVGYGISALSGLSFWISFIIAAVAILTVGLLAVVEDEMPGGFNNPTDEQKQK